ncbi:hypothetical protein [Stenotrophomonas sp.]|uniref:hypothetical protein n=1 Tax=Stenotrophomonas sp. TaxID=69392 RepID=UPI0028AD78B0|nr:hypothetical protein [Stenotrophomonas sp.]
MIDAVASPDVAAEQATIALRAELSRIGTSRLAVLIDPAAFNPLGQLSVYMPERMRPIHLAVKHPDLSSENSPYLLWIDDELSAERLISATFSIAAQESFAGVNSARNARSICAWLPIEADSTFNARSLAISLGANACVSDFQGKSLYFRYFDPRVMGHLGRILGEGQRSALISPLSSWLFLDHRGTIKVAHAERECDVPARKLRLSHQQRIDLERVAWLQQLRCLALTWGMNELPEDHQMDAALSLAQSAGLESQEDCLVFASCVFLLGPRFSKFPLVDRVLSVATRRPGYFASSIARLEDAQLQEIRSATNQQCLLEGYRYE